MSIRDATKGDVPAVLPMVRRMYEIHAAWDREKYTPEGDPGERYGGWLMHRVDDPMSIFLVAEEGGAVVGYLVATPASDMGIYRYREHGFIHDVYIDPSHRGRGLGRAMVEEAVRRFTAAGITQLRLETAAPNEEARRLFRAFGFHEASVLMIRAGEGQP